MAIDKKSRWVRSPSFSKYFATTFGITKSGDHFRLDFGDERVQFAEKEFANVSDCQIVIDKEGFDKFFNLLKIFREKIENKEDNKKK
jgi:hypothetical protein